MYWCHLPFPAELLVVVIGVFLLAVWYEGLKSLREYLVYLNYRLWNIPIDTCSGLREDEDQNNVWGREPTSAKK